MSRGDQDLPIKPMDYPVTPDGRYFVVGLEEVEPRTSGSEAEEAGERSLSGAFGIATKFVERAEGSP